MGENQVRPILEESLEGEMNDGQRAVIRESLREFPFAISREFQTIAQRVRAIP